MKDFPLTSVFLLAGIILITIFSEIGLSQPYLSNLSATKEDPLYTTYAAALERSEFIVDEGYQFGWYDQQRGINFETDQAGNLCLGFKLNGDLHYFLNQMHTEPVITTSYGDLVKYYYYPFENIRVEIFFLVYSSRIAIQDVNVINEGAVPAQLSVYPFLHHANDVLTEVMLIPETDGLTFRHREPPDGWTTGHGVPYEENLRDVYLINSPADAWGAYTELGSLNPTGSEDEEAHWKQSFPGSAVPKHELGNEKNRISNFPPLQGGDRFANLARRESKSGVVSSIAPFQPPLRRSLNASRHFPLLVKEGNKNMPIFNSFQRFLSALTSSQAGALERRLGESAFRKSGAGNLTVTSTSVSGSQLDNYCVEWGLVHHADGSLCYHTPPQAQQIVMLNDTDGEILTESAPKWGDPDPNIPGNGYQGCELGNFDNPAISPGDSFTVIFTCLATGEQGIGRGEVPQILPAPGGVNLDIQLSADPFPPTPQNVQANFFGGNTALIKWRQEPGYTYTLYRRTALTPNGAGEVGEYDRLAAGITDSLWYDFSIDSSNRYGYILAARDNAGGFSGHSLEVNNLDTQSFFSEVQDSLLSNNIPSGDVKVAALQKNFSIDPGQTAHLRIARGVVEDSGDVQSLIFECRNLMQVNLDQFISANEQLYSRIPQLNFSNLDYEMMYWSAFSMIRQCMLPPEGQSSYNYYVFSREPTWGWGHGGQVFHESLTMLAYAFMDSLSAMNSQRVYMERQWSDGYINYRTGPYLNETIPHNNQYTTSAPWYNWENWEIYQISRDTAFLSDAYQSGRDFYNYWLNNRDADNDGLCEWGAHAVLECVRDGQVAIWDQVGWPSNFECLDLNVMLVNEARSLAAMAQELGYANEHQFWTNEANARSDSINRYMWDSQGGFYYHVDKTDHDFSYNSPDDLKRMEIIGFLPLWAGVASQQQADRLLQHLTDPSKFWRNYGVPTLSADDSYYNPLGYWNGPIWVEWQYLIFRGLLRYGYVAEARQLMEKVFENVIHQLKDNHWFWELYSPDDYRAGHHKTYIWSGIVARMLIDMHNATVGMEEEPISSKPERFRLEQNYPNPFNPETVIRYQLAVGSKVELSVYNVLGQKMRTLVKGHQSPGWHEVVWDGRDDSGKPVSSGVYIYRLSAAFGASQAGLFTGQQVMVKKALLIR